jgi:ribose transport system substrate-binding protein
MTFLYTGLAFSYIMKIKNILTMGDCMILKRTIYIVLFLLLSVNFMMMLIFGKETFQIKNKPATAIKYDYHFVLISEEADNPYWRLIEKGARDAAKKYNVYLEYLGPKQVDNSEQLKYMDQSIAGNVDGLIAQGITSKRFDQLVNKAFEKGIPFVTVDTDAPESERAVYVGSDNYRAGVLAGEALIKGTQGEQIVGIVTGRLDSSSQQQRIKGFKDAIQQQRRMKVVATKESNITKSGAVQATYDILREHPDVTAFYGTSALDGTGISLVVNQLQLDPTIISFDILPQTIKLLEEGSIDATVAQYPYEMGYQAIESLLYLERGEHPEELQFTKTKLVRPEHLPSQKPMKGAES